MITIALADPPDLPADSRDVFLPIIGGPPPAVTVNPVTAFYRLLTADQRQQRGRLEVCACLEQAASLRAYGLAVLGDPWSHRDRFGVSPNEYALRAGCNLPASYAAKGNNIELLANGTGEAWAAFEALARGEKHRVALFALNPDGSTNPFFAAQWAVGVAMCEGGDAGWYWCIMMATCE